MNPPDSIVRVHERLDTLIESLTLVTISLARIEGATHQHAEDMTAMREQFAIRDARADMLKNAGELEAKRLDGRITEHNLAVEKDRSYAKGIWKVMSIIGVLMGSVIGGLWTKMERNIDKIDILDTTLRPWMTDISRKQAELDERIKKHESQIEIDGMTLPKPSSHAGK